MPCYDDRNDRELADYRSGEVQRKLDKLTRIACAAMRIVDSGGYLNRTTQEARAWYHAHCALDKERGRR